MEKEFKKLERTFEEQLSEASSLKALEEIKVLFLGKKGKLSRHNKQLKSLPKQEKAKLGKYLNSLKTVFQDRLKEKRESLKKKAFKELMDKEWIDVTIDPFNTESGGLHPLSVIQGQLEDIFTRLGFEILDGPHIETEYYNFEALNIPEHHPARDMQDTFYFEDGRVLRTHTSNIQIRGMENIKPPFRIVGPGKVFRCERSDASHDSCFHQLEGMMVDKNISVSHLIFFSKNMLEEVFEDTVEVRLRPGYFPFVEPGFELDMSCLLCRGQGCAFCKQVGWIELLGCGLVHPNVLRAGGVDPDVYSGFAFGMGMDRLAMLKYNINDIRRLHGGDLKFLKSRASSSDFG